jgi:hypothetical protein
MPIASEQPTEFILSLATLRVILNTLNREHGRWWLEEPLVVRTVNRLPMIQVSHSLAGPDQVTDELSFLVPISSNAIDNEDGTLVFLDPELIEAEIEGLYYERGRVLSDFIADWERFWEPLANAVWEVLARETTRQ